MDQVNFTFKLYPEDVPLTNKYGIRISADEDTIKDIASTEVSRTIANLGIPNLSMSELTTQGRNINVKLSYNQVGLPDIGLVSSPT